MFGGAGTVGSSRPGWVGNWVAAARVRLFGGVCSHVMGVMQNSSYNCSVGFLYGRLICGDICSSELQLVCCLSTKIFL